ncbi:Rhodanese-related sulfurtransferase [Bowdeniella nasicola]|uniref:Rhodanese-related sulfurtransferase n=1 Tax=Bowdeniella nasicola TaxID=208480 RepID=A0A1H3ZRQ7_9ACTO|nr:rhodanese-like domain-containing protein [Bowdeniella nasicola]SEA26446.1 Rhodanese-related sulfurtransferase [Bowdeniella nasicola]
MAIPHTPQTITVADLDVTDPVPDGYVLLDVREDEEWEAGHAPGALHIPLGDLPDRIDELPDEDLLVVCRTGGRSGRAAAWLNQNGYDAYNVDGGMTSWHQAGLPVTSEDGSVPEIL